jgi:hypothetical protein
MDNIKNCVSYVNIPSSQTYPNIWKLILYTFLLSSGRIDLLLLRPEPQYECAWYLFSFYVEQASDQTSITKFDGRIIRNEHLYLPLLKN